MGNHHGRSSAGHRKNHYTIPSSSFPGQTATAPVYNYGPSDQGAQIPKPNMTLALPYAHVDSTLRALAGQAEGFGRCAMGGLHGPLYHVTTLAGNPLSLSVSLSHKHTHFDVCRLMSNL